MWFLDISKLQCHYLCLCDLSFIVCICGVGTSSDDHAVYLRLKFKFHYCSVCHLHFELSVERLLDVNINMEI